MRRAALVAAATVAGLVAAAAPVRAQAAEFGRLELGVGGIWLGGFTLGSANATETSATLQSVPIFTAASSVGGAPAAEARVGWRFTRALSVEANASLARPELRVALSNDVENAPSVTVAERVQQFAVGAALAWHLPVGSPRVAPFVSAGGGYLRELHENATLLQTGRYYRVGGGVDLLLAARAAGRPRALGVRVDARAIVRVNGVAFDDAAHVAPAGGASFFIRF